MHRGRRHTIVMIGAAALGARAASAQQRPARVVLFTRSALPPQDLQAYREALNELGWAEGRNVVLVARDAGGMNNRMGEVARDIVRDNPDVILALQGEAAHAVKAATSTIPIVFTMGDPVGEGLVPSLTRPGGDATGISSLNDELSGKRVEILREALPSLRRLAVMHTLSRGAESQLAAFRRATSLLGMEFGPVPVQDEDLTSAFASAVRQGADAVAAIATPLFRGKGFIALAARNRLPAIYVDSESVEEGGLISYGFNRAALRRRVAALVDRILNGAKPADLPVERPIQFELAINLRTARDLGLTIPPSLIALADRVIE